MSLGFMVRAFLSCAVFTARMLLWALLIKLNSVLSVRPQRNDSLIFNTRDNCAFLMPLVCLPLFTSNRVNTFPSLFWLPKIMATHLETYQTLHCRHTLRQTFAKQYFPLERMLQGISWPPAVSTSCSWKKSW